jgi:hypothetical protein
MCCCFAFAAHALQQAAKRAATYCAVASAYFAASKHNVLLFCLCRPCFAASSKTRCYLLCCCQPMLCSKQAQHAAEIIGESFRHHNNSASL